MKVSQKGLYALKATALLARRYGQAAIPIREIAEQEELPEKFLEIILLELKNARIVESVRGVKGGYRLRKPPSEVPLSEIIRLMDGAIAPFGDADQLRILMAEDAKHRAIYKVFMDVRNAAVEILDYTTLGDICREPRGRGTRRNNSRSRHR
jgi:Rrf2 family protein